MVKNSSRKVLEGVPKVAFAPIHDGKYEFTPFPSCLRSVSRYLGHDVSYHYLLGTSGAAFRLLWHANRWEGGNVDMMFMAEDPLEPFRRALTASGYTAEFLFNGTWHWSDEMLPRSVRPGYRTCGISMRCMKRPMSINSDGFWALSSEPRN